VYPGYTGCKAGNQVCWDAITFRPVGAIGQPPMQWVNRPTYQQADEIRGHRPFPREPACVYVEYPRAVIGTVGAGRVRGTATPRDCGVPSARIVRVQVAIGRPGARARWRTARGTLKWTLRLPATLRRGRYRIEARVIDASGNVGAAPPRLLSAS
jgi:hypothetical protein